MDHSIKDQKRNLRAVLKRYTSKLYNEAIRSDGNISASQLQQIAEIQQLILALDQTESPKPPVRWPVITLLLVTLIIVSILLFARVSSTKVDLELSVSEVGFRSSQSQVFTGITRLSSLGVSGLQEIQFPQTETNESRILNSEGATQAAINLVIDSNNNNESSLTLAPIALQKGNYIWLQPDAEIVSNYQLSMRSRELNLQADVFGNIQAALPGSAPVKLNFTIPKPIVLIAGKNDIDLNIDPLGTAKRSFLTQFFIDSLSLFHIDEYLNNEHTLLRQVSTVNGGTIYYESLHGAEYKLRSNQEIYFRKLKGFIRTMEIKNGQINFAFYGTVSGMSTGAEESSVSLMPTYLEWLKAQYSLSLFWGTSLYFFGLLFSIIHWWRTTK